MKKKFLFAALLNFILNQSANSVYLLEYDDRGIHHIHISFPVANNHLPQNHGQPVQLDLFDGLHTAFLNKNAHFQNNIAVPLTITFWKDQDSQIHSLAVKLFKRKASQLNPLNAQLNFQKNNI
jgi:hypothetical protein